MRIASIYELYENFKRAVCKSFISVAATRAIIAWSGIISHFLSSKWFLPYTPFNLYLEPF